jgi:small subunit ribosomal protein S7
MVTQKKSNLKSSNTFLKSKGFKPLHPLKSFFLRILTKSRFSSVFLRQKFISQFLKVGKKQSIDMLLRSIFRKILLKNYSPLKILIVAVFNIKPVLEIRRLRIKGKTHNIPTPICFNRQISLAIRILSNSLLPSKILENAIVQELFDSFASKSSSVKFSRKQEKIVLRNRLNLKYRF